MDVVVSRRFLVNSRFFVILKTHYFTKAKAYHDQADIVFDCVVGKTIHKLLVADSVTTNCLEGRRSFSGAAGAWL